MMIDWTNLTFSIAGALIGTYMGAVFLYRKQQKRYKNIRKIAIRALKILGKYKKRPYEDASNDFNASLNLTEKRAVLIALYKIGVPFRSKNLGKFNLSEVFLSDDIIDSDEIKDMILQIESGNCDHLFFEDPERYFNKDEICKYKRNIAMRYIKNVFAKSKMDKRSKKICYPDGWWKQFGPEELNMVLVIRDKLVDSYLFEKNTDMPSDEKIQKILEEIDIGLWDMYFVWSYEAFSNVQKQKEFANFAMDVISTRTSNNVSMHHNIKRSLQHSHLPH